jgi:polysaccharide biosynthesis protein PslH
VGISSPDSTATISSLQRESDSNACVPVSLRVLVLDEEIPYPPNSGKRIRTWNLLSRLAQRHKISLLCYGEPDRSSVAAVEKSGIRVHLVPAPPIFRGANLYLRLFANLFSPYPFSVDKHFSHKFQARLEGILATEEIDLVQCEWTPYARFRHAAKHHPFVITAHNVESQIWFRRAEQNRNFLHRLFFGLQAHKMERFERQALSDVRKVTAVTPEDARLMQTWGIQTVSLVENGVDLEYFRPTPETSGAPELLFLASLDWYPNLDALDFLLNQIMPIVHSRRPGTRLRIVGRRPSRELTARIAKLGWAELASDVSDVRPYLSQSVVVVVPLRIGGGSRIKILESLAAGKALVSTSIGAEGLAVVAGEHLRAADLPTDFAREIVDLLAAPSERQRLGNNGRALVVKRYGWDLIARTLESAWLESCSPIHLPGSAATTAEANGMGIAP